MIFGKRSDETAVGSLRLVDDWAAPIVKDHLEKLIVLLREGVNSRARVIASFNPGHVCLAAFVFRRAVLRGRTGHVVRIAPVVGAVVVKERRDRQHQRRAESTNPGEGGERIVLAINVVQDSGGVAGIYRHLIKIAARLSDEAKLVLRVQIENERSEATEAIGDIVRDHGSRRLQPEIGAIATKAGVIREAIGMAAEVELIVSLIKDSSGEDKFGFVVAFESGARGYVEYAVGAVAMIGGGAATRGLESVNVLGIDLRAEVAGDVCVGMPVAVPRAAALRTPRELQMAGPEVS